MTNEEMILERLDRIESQLLPLTDSVKSINELKGDLMPLANVAFHQIIKELEDVESSFRIEDLVELIKQSLRSVRSITFSLRQLQSIVDFVTTLEPLLRNSVPILINYLDELEQKGVFRILNATLGIRAKIAATYSPEDIEKIGDGMVALLGLAKKLTSQQTLAFLEKISEMPEGANFTTSKAIGPFGMLWACSNKEVKEGLGVLMELTKGLGTLKNSDDRGLSAS